MKIESNSDPNDPRPWFDHDLRSDLRADIRDANGAAAADWTTATETDEQTLVEDSSHSLTISSEKPEEVHILLVTTDGQLQFIPESEQPAVCYAHLAWFNPDTGEITQLNFQE